MDDHDDRCPRSVVPEDCRSPVNKKARANSEGHKVIPTTTAPPPPPPPATEQPPVAAATTTATTATAEGCFTVSATVPRSNCCDDPGQGYSCLGKESCIIAPGEHYWKNHNGTTETDYEGKRNDERVVKCTKCPAIWHRVCALHVDCIWPSGFTCDDCHKANGTSRKKNKFTADRFRRSIMILEMTEIGNDLELSFASEGSQLTVDKLQVTLLGNYMEKRVRGLLSHHSEAVGRIQVKVVASSDKETTVRPLMRQWFVDTGKMAEKFPYRSKTILAFQEIDGVDVCFFGMYVQEYGSDCPPPNARRVNISYIDSACVFEPEQLRTCVYHEILCAYLDWVRALGYEMVHIWLRSTTKGLNYIFHRPAVDEMFSTGENMRKWYDMMLMKSRQENTTFRFQNLKEYVADTNLDSPASLPYFEGDYWPSVLEEAIKKVHPRDPTTGDPAHKDLTPEDPTLGGPTSGEITDIGQDVLTGEFARRVRLESENTMDTGSVSKEKDLHSEKTRITRLQSVLLQEIEKKKEEFLVVSLHHPDESSRTHDPDPCVECTMLADQDSFLTWARDRNLEFSSLKYCKFSTMALLHEVLCRKSTRSYECRKCGEISDSCYECTECRDIYLCENCIREHTHTGLMLKPGLNGNQQNNKHQDLVVLGHVDIMKQNSSTIKVPSFVQYKETSQISSQLPRKRSNCQANKPTATLSTNQPGTLSIKKSGSSPTVIKSQQSKMVTPTPQQPHSANALKRPQSTVTKSDMKSQDMQMEIPNHVHPFTAVTALQRLKSNKALGQTDKVKSGIGSQTEGAATQGCQNLSTTSIAKERMPQTNATFTAPAGNVKSEMIVRPLQVVKPSLQAVQTHSQLPSPVPKTQDNNKALGTRNYITSEMGLQPSEQATHQNINSMVDSNQQQHQNTVHYRPKATIQNMLQSQTPRNMPGSEQPLYSIATDTSQQARYRKQTGIAQQGNVVSATVNARDGSHILQEQCIALASPPPHGQQPQQCLGMPSVKPNHQSGNEQLMRELQRVLDADVRQQQLSARAMQAQAGQQQQQHTYLSPEKVQWLKQQIAAGQRSQNPAINDPAMQHRIRIQAAVSKQQQSALNVQLQQGQAPSSLAGLTLPPVHDVLRAYDPRSPAYSTPGHSPSYHPSPLHPQPSHPVQSHPAQSHPAQSHPSPSHPRHLPPASDMRIPSNMQSLGHITGAHRQQFHDQYDPMYVGMSHVDQRPNAPVPHILLADPRASNVQSTSCGGMFHQMGSTPQQYILNKRQQHPNQRQQHRIQQQQHPIQPQQHPIQQQQHPIQHQQHPFQHQQHPIQHQQHSIPQQQHPIQQQQHPIQRQQHPNQLAQFPNERLQLSNYLHGPQHPSQQAKSPKEPQQINSAMSQPATPPMPMAPRLEASPHRPQQQLPENDHFPLTPSSTRSPSVRSQPPSPFS